MNFFAKICKNLSLNTINGRNITRILLEIYWNRVFDFDNVVFLQKN